VPRRWKQSVAHLLPIYIQVYQPQHLHQTISQKPKPNYTRHSSPSLPYTHSQGRGRSRVSFKLFLFLGLFSLLEFLTDMAGTGPYAEILDGDVYKYYSEGEWKKSSSGKSVAIINPTTRKTQYKVQGDQPIFCFV